MNRLREMQFLSNRYHAMRHGHSLANEAGVVVSQAANGLGEYGLSEAGRRQVDDCIENAPQLDSGVLIVSSDFRRARETAERVHAGLGCDAALIFDARLRERDFGDYELGPDSIYAEVWERDRLDADGCERGVESANRVMTRVTELVVELEQAYRGADLLLVSHGDALQILQAAFDGRDASAHRDCRHLQTAEIRPLRLARSARR